MPLLTVRICLDQPAVSSPLPQHLLCALPSFAQTEGNHIAVSSAHPVAAIQDTETPSQRDARMAWWRDARFGMFIHWGLYSIPAGTWNGKQIRALANGS